MFQKVDDASFVSGEHEVLRFWSDAASSTSCGSRTRGNSRWTFLDGPITANNPMGVHHAWGRTYKDAFQRYWAMNGRELRYQNGFDCQGLWVEVEVEKELELGTKTGIDDYGIDKFVQRVQEARPEVRRAPDRAIDPPRLLDGLGRSRRSSRTLAEAVGTDKTASRSQTPSGQHRHATRPSRSSRSSATPSGAAATSRSRPRTTRRSGRSSRSASSAARSTAATTSCRGRGRGGSAYSPDGSRRRPQADDAPPCSSVPLLTGRRT